MCGKLGGKKSPCWKIFITQLSRFQEVFLVIDVCTEALRMY